MDRSVERWERTLWTDFRELGLETTADLALEGVEPLEQPRENSLEEQPLGERCFGRESLSILVVKDLDLATIFDWPPLFVGVGISVGVGDEIG